jgi:chemotaxis protein MotB
LTWLTIAAEELAKTKADRDKFLADYTATDKNLKTLQASYSALEKNSDDALKTNMDKNRELLSSSKPNKGHSPPSKPSLKKSKAICKPALRVWPNSRA